MENMNLTEITNMVANKQFKEAKELLEKCATNDEKHIEETCREGNNDLTRIGMSIYNIIQVF